MWSLHLTLICLVKALCNIRGKCPSKNAMSDVMAGSNNRWRLLLEIPFQRYSTLQIVTEQNAVPRYTDLFPD